MDCTSFSGFIHLSLIVPSGNRANIENDIHKKLLIKSVSTKFDDHNEEKMLIQQ